MVHHHGFVSNKAIDKWRRYSAFSHPLKGRFNSLISILVFGPFYMILVMDFATLRIHQNVISEKTC